MEMAVTVQIATKQIFWKGIPVHLSSVKKCTRARTHTTPLPQWPYFVEREHWIIFSLLYVILNNVLCYFVAKYLKLNVFFLGSISEENLEIF